MIHRVRWAKHSGMRAWLTQKGRRQSYIFFLLPVPIRNICFDPVMVLNDNPRTPLTGSPISVLTGEAIFIFAHTRLWDPSSMTAWDINLEKPSKANLVHINNIQQFVTRIGHTKYINHTINTFLSISTPLQKRRREMPTRDFHIFFIPQRSLPPYRPQ